MLARNRLSPLLRDRVPPEEPGTTDYRDDDRHRRLAVRFDPLNEPGKGR
jgi:hypothetical protein